jgi:hypothetical protein
VDWQRATTIFWNAGAKASCDIADILAEVTENRAHADQALLEFANALKMRNYPRGKEYLTHFLNGAGTDKTFRLAELLLDAGVRRTIVKHFKQNFSKINKVITIGQLAYEDKDWKYALGTYFIYYEDVGEFANSSGNTVRYVKAKGLDTYQWHPEDTKRYTNCIHQAAYRLQKPLPGRDHSAKPFRMIATEAIIDTTTGREEAMPSIPRSEILMIHRRIEQSIPMGK